MENKNLSEYAAIILEALKKENAELKEKVREQQEEIWKLNRFIQGIEVPGEGEWSL